MWCKYACFWTGFGFKGWSFAPPLVPWLLVKQRIQMVLGMMVVFVPRDSVHQVWLQEEG